LEYEVACRISTAFSARLSKAPTSGTERDGHRKLLSASYLSLILFGLLNPLLKAMRGLVEASALPRA